MIADEPPPMPPPTASDVLHCPNNSLDTPAISAAPTASVAMSAAFTWLFLMSSDSMLSLMMSL
jgi:hypothetical protein